MEYISRPQGQSNFSSENDRKGASKGEVGDDTSFGLLPSDAVENCTLYNTVGHPNMINVESSRVAIFGISRLQPPTPDEKEPSDIVIEEKCIREVENNSNPKIQYEYIEEADKAQKSPSRPTSQISYNPNDSIETVVRKRSNQTSPHLMRFSPEPIARPTSQASENVLRNNIESPHQLELESNCSTSQLDANDKIDDVAQDLDFDFMNAPAQEFGEGLNFNEEFNDLQLNNTDFINAEEEANEEAYRFLQEEDMHISSSSCHQHQHEWSGFFGAVNNSGKVSDAPKVASDTNISKQVREEDCSKEESASPDGSSRPMLGNTPKDGQSPGLPLDSGSLDDGMNDYFRKGTSRIGESLEDHSIPSTDNLAYHARPDFGFDKIKSPKRVPVNILEVEEVQDNGNASNDNQPKHDTSYHEEQQITSASHDNSTAKEVTLQAPINVDYTPASSLHEHINTKELNLQGTINVDNTPVPEISTSKNADHSTFTDKNENTEGHENFSAMNRNETPPQKLDESTNWMPDILLQHSVQETVLEETGVEVDTGMILEIIRNAAPGHDPKYYASLVIKHMTDFDHETNKKAAQNSLIQGLNLSASHTRNNQNVTSISRFLPSFLEDSSEIDLSKDLFCVNKHEMKKFTQNNPLLTRSSTSELHNDISITSNKSAKLKNRKPSTPNKLKHSSPIKKPPTTKLYSDYKENSSMVSNLSSRILAVAEIGEDGSGRSSLKLDHLSAYKELNASAMKNKFPIESDKASMNWFSTQIDEKGDTQKVKLQNILETTTLRVRLIIRDSNEFIFRENHVKGLTKPPHFLDIILPPKGMKDVHVIYTPKNPGFYSKGKLILKPQLSGMKNVKASITLLGYSGCANMKFEYQSQNLRKLENERLNSMNEQFGEEIKIVVKNQGDIAGFAKLCAFSASDFKSSVPKNDLALKKIVSLHVENRDIILNPNEEEITMKIKLNKSQHDIHPDETIHFVLFHGTEIHRQALTIAKQNHPYTATAPELSVHQDFSSFNSPLNYFNEEYKDIVSIENITTFFEKLNRIDFQIRFHAATKTFYKLTPEETLNESRFMMTSIQNNTNPYDSLSFSRISDLENSRARDGKERNGTSFENGRKDELELAVNTTNSQIAILPYKSNMQTDQRDNMEEGLQFSVLAASKPSFIKHNLKESKRKIHPITHPQEATSKSFQPKHIQSKSRSGVFLDKTELYFPAVRLDDHSVVKVTVKNRTKKSAFFTANTLSAPFTSYHTSVEVKPNFYLNIPIKYSPTLKDGKGPHECFLKLEENIADGKVLIVRLIGRRQ